MKWERGRRGKGGNRGRENWEGKKRVKKRDDW